MASFLNGIMGGLKSALGGAGAAGKGLFNGLEDAFSGEPNDMARAPGSGGLLKATDSGRFVGIADPTLDDPISRQTGVQEMRRMPTLEAAPKEGFFKRINNVDPETGLSTVDKWDRFGGRLQDISEGGDRAADVDKLAGSRRAKQAQADLSAQIDQLFPNDPKMRFLLKANPGKATEAMADIYKSRNEAYTLGKGQQRGAGGQLIDAAPDYGVEDGYAWERDPEGGFQWGGQRGRTYGETETQRHNRAEEALGGGNLGVSRDRLALERSRAARAAAGGGGAAGAGGLGGMSTADLVKILRGAR